MELAHECKDPDRAGQTDTPLAHRLDCWPCRYYGVDGRHAERLPGRRFRRNGQSVLKFLYERHQFVEAA
jgi:hypothetical protein